MNSCLERGSLFPLPLPGLAQPGSNHLKWAPGSLGEGLAWFQAPTPDAPARPSSSLPLQPSPSWGQEVRGRAFSPGSSTSGSTPAPTHTQHGIPPIAPSLGEAGGAGKSVPSPFPRGTGAGEWANATPWGYSRAEQWGTSPGGAPTLPIALDKYSLTQATPPAPHPLNKQ